VLDFPIFPVRLLPPVRHTGRFLPPLCLFDTFSPPGEVACRLTGPDENLMSREAALGLGPATESKSSLESLFLIPILRDARALCTLRFPPTQPCPTMILEQSAPPPVLERLPWIHPVPSPVARRFSPHLRKSTPPPLPSPRRSSKKQSRLPWPSRHCSDKSGDSEDAMSFPRSPSADPRRMVAAYPSCLE